MWADVVTGKNLRASNERKKHENINDRNLGRTGYKRFGARIQSTNWPAKTSARNAYAAADLRTSRSGGSNSARI
jgi:hypothetical protein